MSFICFGSVVAPCSLRRWDNEGYGSPLNSECLVRRVQRQFYSSKRSRYLHVLARYSSHVSLPFFAS